ncbi:unnamed protein product [Durusdinium trenchii]|uniref:Uncharacterized protein n=1 Tax=Durusdinium trenchii TaxID=1381693 RepID=A0ABP0SAL0_9DINO
MLTQKQTRGEGGSDQIVLKEHDAKQHANRKVLLFLFSFGLFSPLPMKSDLAGSICIHVQEASPELARSGAVNRSYHWVSPFSYLTLSMRSMGFLSPPGALLFYETCDQRGGPLRELSASVAPKGWPQVATLRSKGTARSEVVARVGHMG